MISPKPPKEVWVEWYYECGRWLPLARLKEPRFDLAAGAISQRYVIATEPKPKRKRKAKP